MYFSRSANAVSQPMVCQTRPRGLEQHWFLSIVISHPQPARRLHQTTTTTAATITSNQPAARGESLVDWSMCVHGDFVPPPQTK